MGTPLEDEAARVGKRDKTLVSRDKLNHREQSLLMHWPSVKNVVGALKRLSALILNGRIDTDLYVKHSGDLTTAKRKIPKRQYPALYKFNIVPTAPVLSDRRPLSSYNGNGPEEGLSWHPNVALQISLSLDDTYKKAGDDMQPTGELSLQAHFRSWGGLSPEDIEKISRISASTVDYRDQGWDTKGSSVFIHRRAGELISLQEAETVLATLADHILNHRSLHQREPLEKDAYSKRGNFSSSEPDSSESSTDTVLEVTGQTLGITDSRTG